MSGRLRREGAPPAPGIVHFGLGAFFRAHGALYVEEAVRRSGGDWGIVGVSLRSPGTRDRLRPQGGVYTAVELGPDGHHPRRVEILADVLVAPEEPGAVLAALADASLVTLTITEKGYCHVPATGELDPEHPDIRRDLADADRPASAMGFIVRALQARRDAGRDPFTVLSCDNMPQNGTLLRGLVLTLAERIDPALAEWIGARVAFPCSMVDRIVPATTAQDMDRVEALVGARDEAPVLHEPFRQWVIEDRFCAARPDLAAVGAELVAEVAPYEHMKLRCLNGTHSALAYLGYLAGAETIAEAIALEPLERYVRHLWAKEIVPVLEAPPGIDLAEYTDALHARYANPSMHHRTAQIAMDGSRKLPQRILEVIAENLARGREPAGLYLAVAAWMRYGSGRDLDDRPIDVQDPMAEQLAACWDGAAPAAEVVRRFLELDAVFEPAFAAREEVRSGLVAALERLLADGAARAAGAVATSSG